MIDPETMQTVKEVIYWGFLGDPPILAGLLIGVVAIAFNLISGRRWHGHGWRARK